MHVGDDFFQTLLKTKVLFSRVAKVGSTEFFNFFWSLHDSDTSNLEQMLENRDKGDWVHQNDETLNERLPKLSSLDRTLAETLLKNTSKLVYIRDPLDRLVSAWKDKLGPLQPGDSVEQKKLFYVFIFQIYFSLYFRTFR